MIGFIVKTTSITLPLEHKTLSTTLVPKNGFSSNVLTLPLKDLIMLNVSKDKN